MTDTKLARRIAAGLVIALAVSACGGGESPSPTGAAATATPAATDGPTDAPTQAPTPSGDPIVVGSTLSLTGPFGATGVIHKIAGELFIERLNDAGGLLGRPVEWVLLDDESDQARVSTLYERLISQDQVDLIIGPYATPNILSAVAVAERHGYVMPQHTAVLAPLLPYDCQFPAWSIGPEPNVYVPTQLFDALDTLPEPPQTIAFLSNQSGATDFVAYGQADVDDPGAVSIAEDRGYEVVAEIRYPPGTTDWGPMATEIRDAEPDFVMMNSLGVESLGLIQAMEQLNYRPPLMFSLFPAPGPLIGAGEPAQGHLSVSMFEGTAAAIERMGPAVREIVEAFEAEAEAAGLPYTSFETQATASWNAWEILVAGVEAAGALDQDDICQALIDNGAQTTFSGTLEFDPEVNNFWDSTQGIKQIQGTEWVMVYPGNIASAEIQGPAN